MNYLRISLLVLVALMMSSGDETRRQCRRDASQNQSTALERGYRTGYSDGYNAGTRDTVDNAARDYRNKEDYQRADRSYNQAWGTIEDYRDGYQQGFEAGYAAGYDRRPFDSTIPTGLERFAAHGQLPNVNESQPTTRRRRTLRSRRTRQTAVHDHTPVANSLYIARDTILLVELESTSFHRRQPARRSFSGSRDRAARVCRRDR